MRGLAIGLCVGLAGLAAAWGQQASGNRQACEELAKLALPHTRIVQAAEVEAGKLAPPDDSKNPIFGQLPAFCRVVAEAHPSSDSQIKIEVWLPVSGWNGRFLGQGNGGFAGSIYYRDLASAVQHGYASAGTDTGHTGSTTEAAWALGHPEKVIDFGYRGVHEMTLTGQAITKAFYGRAPGHRYFSSCSDGGREALMEAQRFPADYDGILAGAPAYNWTHLVASGIHSIQALQGKPASRIPASKLPAIHDAVLAQCGKGGSDGFLVDPRQCHFDPGALLCKGAESGSCLTGAQVTALKALYAGARTKDGKLVDYGLLPGAELGRNGWEAWVTGSDSSTSLGSQFLTGYFADLVYGRKDLDVQKLNLDAALKAAESKTGSVLDAVNPDLSAFSARGGKLILYHGWNDPAIPAEGTVDYFNSVVATAGEQKAAEFTRLYMVPGMQHCGGGPGPASFGQRGPADLSQANDLEHNIYLALQAWVETGAAPGTLIAEHIERAENGAEDEKPVVTLTRPLCPYPQEAGYAGKGDREKAASYVCAASK
ncbi:MAG: tannase/feruloyl esterase family alpha/beta hydrolase [Acidobacteriota bacterium]|nr:tannase/feruloyl esterase family alpha/beta hydrolase [Acidobacteriota bacterium]